jgi:hypothetical protein
MNRSRPYESSIASSESCGGELSSNDTRTISPDASRLTSRRDTTTHLNSESIPTSSSSSVGDWVRGAGPSRPKLVSALGKKPFLQVLRVVGRQNGEADLQERLLPFLLVCAGSKSDCRTKVQSPRQALRTDSTDSQPFRVTIDRRSHSIQLANSIRRVDANMPIPPSRRKSP